MEAITKHLGSLSIAHIASSTDGDYSRILCAGRINPYSSEGAGQETRRHIFQADKCLQRLRDAKEFQYRSLFHRLIWLVEQLDLRLLHR